MRGRQWKALAVAVALATSFAACAGDEEAGMEGSTPAADTEGMAPAPAADQPAMDLPEGVTQEQVSQGRQLFTGAGGCHACHGPQATGTQLGPDLTDGEWINVSGPNVEEVAQLIRTGVPQPVQHPGPMPPMGGANLSAEQVQALAAYVVTLGQG